MEWGWILLLAVAAYWLYAFSQNWAKKKQLGPGAQLHRFYRREGKRESSPMAGRSFNPIPQEFVLVHK